MGLTSMDHTSMGHNPMGHNSIGLNSMGHNCFADCVYRRQVEYAGLRVSLDNPISVLKATDLNLSLPNLASLWRHVTVLLYTERSLDQRAVLADH